MAAQENASNADGAVLWLRMSDKDLELFGGPEWVGFDAGALYNMPATELEAFEDEMGFFLHTLLRELLGNGTRATRGALFIARRKAGVQERYAGFDPHTMQVVHRFKPETGPGDGSHAVKAGRGKPRRAAATSPPGSPGEASPPSSTT